MRLGLGTYAYRWSIGIGDYRPPQPMSPLELLHKTAALGLSLVQYADNLPLHHLSDADLHTLAAAAKELGITIELGVQGLKPDLLHKYLALAQVLDARLIRLALDSDDARKPLGQLVQDFTALLPHYAAQGVELAIENHFHFPSPKLLSILKRVNHPSLGICLDVANSIAIQEWPDETIRLLAPYAMNLHLKDYRIQLDPYGVGFTIVGTPLGQGQLDIPAVFAALNRAGRDVNVILEHWLPQAATAAKTQQLEDDWLAQSVQAAQAFMPQASTP